MDFVPLLRKVKLFRDFPESEIDKIAQYAKDYDLPAGGALFKEGDAAEEFFVVLVGTVRVLKKNRDGNPEEVARLATGSYFGEVEFVSDGSERIATIEAQENTRVIGFRYDELHKLMDEDRSLGFHLYRAMARGLAARLSNTTKDAAYFKAIALRHS